MAERRLKFVLNTNALLVSISDRSSFYWLYRGMIDGEFEVAVSTEILNEYAEIISRRWHADVANDVLRTLLELPNVILITPFFRMNLITEDADDNKFVDCAFAAGADYLITNDRHFDVLNGYNFPRIQVMTLQAMAALVGK